MSLASAEEWEEYWSSQTFVSAASQVSNEQLPYDVFAPALRPLLASNPMSKIMDLGCGTSGMMAALWEDGFRNLTGIDWSVIAISFMQMKYESLGMNIWVMDARNMNFSSEHMFDFVIAKEVLIHSLTRIPKDVFTVLREIRRNLKPSGTLVIIDQGEVEQLLEELSLEQNGFCEVELRVLSPDVFMLSCHIDSSFTGEPAPRRLCPLASNLSSSSVSSSSSQLSARSSSSSQHETIMTTCTALGFSRFDIMSVILQLESSAQSTSSNASAGIGVDINAVLDLLQARADALASAPSSASISSSSSFSSSSSPSLVSSPSALSAASASLPTDKDELRRRIESVRRRREERFGCKLCFEKEISSCLLPCGHLCSCTPCAIGLKHCPMCQADISRVVNIKFN